MTRTAAIVLVLVGIGWLWEIIALTTRRIPTITEVVRAQRSSIVFSLLVVAAIVAAAGWAIAHLLA